MSALPEGEAWYQRAWTLVLKRHTGKADQLGRPYVQHFVRVTGLLLQRFPAATRAQVQAALLHDALEPGGGLNGDTLHRAGIEAGAVAIIRNIALPADDRPYQQYIDALCASGDISAIQVKLADNLDAFALYTALGDEASVQLVRTRYVPARRALEAALGKPEV